MTELLFSVFRSSRWPARPSASVAPSKGHCRLPRKLLSRSFIRCLCNEFVHGPSDYSHSLLSHSSTILKQMRSVGVDFAPEFLECFAHKYLCEARVAVGNEAERGVAPSLFAAHQTKGSSFRFGGGDLHRGATRRGRRCRCAAKR